jgi:hypothetical protein
MAAGAVVRGLVQDVSIGVPVPGAQVCLTSGHDAVAQTRADAGGRFELAVPAGLRPVTVLVLAPALEAWRRSPELGGAGADLDLGTIGLAPSEYLPGVHGQLWDADADRPVPAGRVALAADGATVSEQAVASDGGFVFELSCARPLPAGDYEIHVDAHGYEPQRVAVAIVDEVTVYQVGRIELQAGQREGSGAGR